jgi:hypothetical protein
MRLGLLTILLLLLLGVHSSAVIAGSISSLRIKDDEVVLTVPALIVGGDDELVNGWLRAIEQTWNLGNDGGPFVVCGRRVRFEPVFTRGSSPQVARNSHLVTVERVRDGRNFVSSVAYVLGTSPSYSRRAASWASNMDARTVAHEFGHLLGLIDEYVENDVNLSGHREPGEVPRPDLGRFPDAWFSLMATERGVVLSRHLAEVVRVHGGEELLGCR